MVIVWSDLNNAAALAVSLGVRLVRIIIQLLGHWKQTWNKCKTVIVPNSDDPFPCLGVRHSFDNCAGSFLDGSSLTLLNLEEVKGEAL